MLPNAPFVLAFDTANEVIAIGIGRLHRQTRTVSPVASQEIGAHRASNTQLIPRIDALLAEQGIQRSDLACIACGRGPGSFTGVRIAMATAKGIASALELPLIGVSTLDAIAWQAWRSEVRGRLLVAADAMRHEVYPVHYELTGEGIQRLEADRVLKAEAAALEQENSGLPLQITGDALKKYGDLFEPFGVLLPESLWTPTGTGLLYTLQALWQAGAVDPFDAVRHNPAFALPVYTRLSDAEENERVRLSRTEAKDLLTGVQGQRSGSSMENQNTSGSYDGATLTHRVTMHEASLQANEQPCVGVIYRPLDGRHVKDVASLEARIMGSDAWNESLVADELPRKDRTWWAAYKDGSLIGYAGGWVVDGDLQILKVGVVPSWQRHGIARELLGHVAEDARNLGANRSSLEVRVGNQGAQKFYESLGYTAAGVRPRYYSDHEDAVIMQGPLPLPVHDVAGIRLQSEALTGASEQGDPSHSIIKADSDSPELPARTRREHPLILAIETSCDETAAAIIDGRGTLVSDVVASQVDFHARFGGVVPEIASRKHIEAICGVCDECLDLAGDAEGSLRWKDLDAIAVTYAPGLVGALVVGVAFAKGAAWACEKPFIGVNHLEGHLYANKLGDETFAPPAVVSLVSGGNTMLVFMKDWGNYETLGATIDDAVGEAFDKVAKALGLGYPGGPVISRYAAQGNPDAILFPRAMIHSGDLRFSLSGLKTAVVTYINKEREAGRELNIPDIAASFQQAVVDVQVAKARMALDQTGAKTLCVGGGVAANPALRSAYEDFCREKGVKLILPPLSACGDNAAMIALVALDRYNQGKFFGLEHDAAAHADLDKPY